MDHYRFTRTCVRGLLFLKKSQTSEGSFPALIFSDDENYSNNKESPTIFHTSLILELIGNLSTHHQNFENYYFEFGRNQTQDHQDKLMPFILRL